MARDAGNQHVVNTLTVNKLIENMVNTICWSALAVMGSVSWHAEAMTADEFQSILNSVPAEGEQTYSDH